MRTAGEWAELLDKETFHVMREGGTEPRGTYLAKSVVAKSPVLKQIVDKNDKDGIRGNQHDENIMTGRNKNNHKSCSLEL